MIQCGRGTWDLKAASDGAVGVSDDLEVVIGINGADRKLVLILMNMTRHIGDEFS